MDPDASSQQKRAMANHTVTTFEKQKLTKTEKPMKFTSKKGQVTTMLAEF